MAEYLVKSESITPIADEIRTILGLSDSMGLDDMVNGLNDANSEVDSQSDLIGEIATALAGKTSEGYNIRVTVDNGATVTATKGSNSVTGVSDGVCVLNVREPGNWTVSATLNGDESNIKTVNVSNAFVANLVFFTAHISVNTSAGATVTAVKDDTTITTTASDLGIATFTIKDPGDWQVTTIINGRELHMIVSVTSEIDYYISFDRFILDNNSWADIRKISDAGTAKNYWSVGDCKAVNLYGTMGTLNLDTTLYVYILGFDHNKEVEGSGIHFGCFKTNSGFDGIDVCLVDDIYSKSSYDGTLCLNMNHWSSGNHGGWSRSDMRYDILGSTDIAPSGYGTSPSSGEIGYAPSTTCATNPVANTLMSCFPEELRAVMKPITKWTDNVGGGVEAEANISATVDYLPLLAEFEIFGARTYANSYEQNHQVQYEYFSAGNSKVKYSHSATGSTAHWWERSTSYADKYYFCNAGVSGSKNMHTSNFSLGVSPTFMV